jgi:hypothetical protein
MGGLPVCVMDNQNLIAKKGVERGTATLEKPLASLPQQSRPGDGEITVLVHVNTRRAG